MSTAKARRPYFYMIFLGALLLIPALGLTVTFMNAHRVTAPEALQSFTLPDLNDPSVTIHYPPTDKAAIINVFASWCPPCKAEHPLLMELKQKYGVPIYGIAWSDKPEDTKKFLKDMGNPYVSVSSDMKNVTGEKLAVTGTPETIVVDEYGNVLYSQRGPLDADIVRNMIAPILASR